VSAVAAAHPGRGAADLDAEPDAGRRTGPTIRLRRSALRYGNRTLWSDLDLNIAPGEFLAVLGPNGSGKTSLLKVVLGLQHLSTGSVSVCGRTPHRGSSAVGYVPQQKAFDRDLPLRGTDLVRLGLDGHRWGIARANRAARARVAEVIAAVGATTYADLPVGLLSGGEQQRLRVAQALVGDPRVLLCDEPLLSLDLAHQQAVSALIDNRRRAAGTSVVFVSHEVNPVLALIDRVLYLVDGRWAIGAPDQVMTSARLSELYGADIDVLRVRDRIVVVGAPDGAHAGRGGHHHDPVPADIDSGVR
jgi:zinc/manganese transport system ATP-binding protein